MAYCPKCESANYNRKAICDHCHARFDDPNRSVMAGIGIALVILAVLVGFFAAFMDTSVESGSSFGGSGRIHNMGLMQNQLITALFSVALFMSGIVLIAAGNIANRLPHAPVATEVAPSESPSPAELDKNVETPVMA